MFPLKKNEPKISRNLKYAKHSRIQKVLSEGSNLDNVFFLFFCLIFFPAFFSLLRGGSNKYQYKQAINGPSAKRLWLADDGPKLNAGLVAL